MVPVCKNWLRTDHPPRAVFPPHLFTISLEFSITRSFREPIFLHQKYVLEGLTPAQIATQSLSSKKTIIKWLHKLSIPLRKEDGVRPPKQAPFGKRMVCGELVPNLNEIKTIETVFNHQKFREFSNQAYRNKKPLQLSGF